MDRSSTASHGESQTEEPTAPAAPCDLESATSLERRETETPWSWHSLLAGSPREVLARLVQDDPLGVRARAAARLRSDALLLDGDRVHLRALARISRASGAYRGRPELSDWVDGAVAATVEELVREEYALARARVPVRDDRTSERGVAPSANAAPLDPDAFASLAVPLGLDPASMRRACAVFCVLPFAERSAFFELVLDAGDLDAAASAAGVSASEIARRARRALDAILAPALGLVAEPEKARKR